MQRLISDLCGWLSGYHHRLRDIADRGSACVRRFIRVGLKSAVIKEATYVPYPHHNDRSLRLG